MKVCTGVGITLSIVGLLWFMVSFIVTLKVYHNVKECVRPQNYEMKQVVYKEDNIHRIDFNMITGYVNIGFHDKPEIEIHHFDRYKKGHLFDANTVNSKISNDQGLITIISESPAFDFSSCQHTSIDIFIPRKTSRHISLTGIIKTGAVYIFGEHSIPVGSVDIIVEVGYIKVKHLNAQALSLSSEVGIIKAKDIMAASGIKLNVNTGSINSNQISTKTLNANVKYGVSRHSSVVADLVNVETNWGYSSVKDVLSFEKNQKIYVKTVYGKSLLLLSNPHIDFAMSNKKGELLIDYKQKEYKCNVFLNKTVSVLGGKCNSLIKDAPVNIAFVSIDSVYGISEMKIEKDD